MTQSSPPVLALVRDLMFVGRIVAEARAAGVPLTVIRDPAKLSGVAGRLLIVDLNLDGALDAAAAWAEASRHPTVAFAAHTDTSTIARARAAGLPQVLARSAFVDRLPGLLKAAADHAS